MDGREVHSAAAPRAAGDALPEDLVVMHLPLVRALAARLYRLRWDDSVGFDEYCQMGALGLVEAAGRYDPSRGAQFSTFASWRITGAILNGLERSTELHQQSGARRRMIQERSQSLAEAHGTRSATEAPHALEAVLARLADAAVGLAIGFMLEGSGMYSDGTERTRRDGYASLATGELAGRLRQAVDSLPVAERAVITSHYFQQQPFQDIAARLKLSKGRISQLHRRAIERLHAAMADDMIGFEG
jgi:RNA polymerase sigma factor for flagellar operon FliA